MRGDGLRHTLSMHLAVILLFAVLLALLLALPVQIRIVYEGRGRQWSLRLKIGILKGRLGLKIGLPPPPKVLQQQSLKLKRSRAGGGYKMRLGINRASFNFLVQWRRWRELVTVSKRIIGVFKEFLHRCVCTKLLWVTGFGLDDYAATGMITGLLWAGKGLLLSLLSRHLRIKPAGVRIAVAPQFGGACYLSTMDCILETSLGYIILVAFKLGATWLARKELFVRGKRYA
jgi:hypothetical protein